MANDNCRAVSSDFRDRVLTLVQEWRNNPYGSKRASFNVVKNIEGISDMSEEEQNNAIAAYFIAVIDRFTEDGEELEVPTASRMDQLLSDDLRMKEEKRLQEQETLDRIPIIVGLDDNSIDSVLTGIPNNEIEISSKQRRENLAGIVERSLKRRLGSLYDKDVHGKLVNIIRGNAYKGTVDNLYKAVFLAAQIDEDGNPQISADLLKNVLQGNKTAITNMNSKFEALGLNEGEYLPIESKILGEIVDVYLLQNKPAMDAIKQNKARTIRSSTNATRSQRAFAKALRTARKGLDRDEIDFSRLIEYRDMQTLRGKLPFTVTKQLFDTAEEFLMAWADRQNPEYIKERFNTYVDTEATTADNLVTRTVEGNPFGGISDFLWNSFQDTVIARSPMDFVEHIMSFTHRGIEVTRDVHGNITRITAKGRPVTHTYFNEPFRPNATNTAADKDTEKYPRKEDGTLTDESLSSDEVIELMRMCYDMALSRAGVTGGAVRLQEALKISEGQNFVYKEDVESWHPRLAKEMMYILDEIRESLIVEQSNDDEERAAIDEDFRAAMRSKSVEEAKHMTTTACAVVYDSRTLRMRTEAIADGIMQWCDRHRWSELVKASQRAEAILDEVVENQKDIDNLREFIKHPEGFDGFSERTKAYNVSDKFAAESRIEMLVKRNEELNREFDGLDRYEKDLMDDNLFFPAILRRNMSTALKFGQGKVVKDPSALSVSDELTMRALALIEDRSGVHIIFDRKTMQYTVADAEQALSETSDDGLQGDDEEGIQNRRDDMDFDPEIDPFAHLTLTIRFGLSRIPKKDFEGNVLTDDLGNPQYYDPRDIYAGILDICGDLVVDSTDLYRLVTEGLNAVDKNVQGITRNGLLGIRLANRTEKDAYPKGKPEFGILQDNIGRYPWVSDLITRLQEDWMSWTPTDYNGDLQQSVGRLTTDLFDQLGQVFMARMQVKDNKMVVSNQTSGVQNAKATQRHNFYTRAKLSVNEKEARSVEMLWEDPESVLGRFDHIKDDINFDSFKQGAYNGLTTFDGEPLTLYHAESITEALRAMGLEIELATVLNIVEHGNSKMIDRLRNLCLQCGYVALNIYNGASSVDDIYDNNFSNWKQIYILAGPLVKTQAFMVTSTENGKTRQNYIYPNSFTTKFSTVGYGSDTMRKGRDESYADEDLALDPEIMERRRQKIDAEHRQVAFLYDEERGEYDNTLLQQFYSGSSLDVGQTMQSDTYEGKDYRQLDASEQLAMQLAAFERPKTMQGRRPQPEYIQFVSMADVPCAQFISVDYGPDIDGAVDALVKRTLRERQIIQMHKDNRIPYALAQAVAMNKVRRDYSGYYNAITGQWEEVAEEYKESFKTAIGLVRLYKERAQAKTDEEVREAATKIAKYKDKHPDAVQLTGLDTYQEYESFRKWIPRDGYFGREEKYGEIPNLNKMRLSYFEIRDAIESLYNERMSKKGLKEEQKAEIQDQMGLSLSLLDTMMSSSGDRRLTIDDALSMISDDQTVKEVAEAYVRNAMQSRYKAYLRTLRAPFREWSEKANLNRIEHSLRGEPDFDGDMWEIDDRGDDGVFLEHINGNRKPVELSKEEAAYYRKRMQGWEDSQAKQKFDEQADPQDQNYQMDMLSAMQEFFKLRKSGEIPGKEMKHKFESVLNFVPPLKNMATLKEVIRSRRSTSFKPLKVSFNDVMDSIERLFYHTYAGNSEILEMFGMRQAMFKSPSELTKRVKILYSNGTRLDSQAGDGAEVEHMLVVADHATAISTTYGHTLSEFRDSIKKKRTSGATSEQIEAAVVDAYSKAKAHTNINATDGQGHLPLPQYHNKASQAGTTYMSSRQERTVHELENGAPDTEHFDQSGTLGTIKQCGGGVNYDIDPRGNVEAMPVAVKNSEALLLSADNVPDTHRSAQMMALERYVSQTEFSDGSMIGSIQRDSSIKTQKKGVLALHYLDSRVEALINLSNGRIPSRQKAEKFVQEWSGEVDNAITLTPDLVVAFARIMRGAASTLGIDINYLTFDDIDGYVHDRISALSEQYLRTQDDSRAEVLLNNIQHLQDIVAFMQPVKSTENTLQELEAKIDAACRNPDGSRNDQYMLTIQRKYQHMQIRPTNHSYDAKAHLGSQWSYIMQTCIDFDETYTVGGHELKGDQLYRKFNEALAQRLLYGVREAGAKFANLEELRDFMLNIVQNNPKYGPEVVRALDIVYEVIDGEKRPVRFSTPLSSVAIIYKVSDILTSIIRNKTHRRPVNGGNLVIEADTMYDERLGIQYDADGNMVGVECFMPAWAKDILETCLRKRMVKKNIRGRIIEVEEQFLDFDKVKGTGLEKMLGYRIPTEDIHSIMPLIVKGFLPASRGSSIVVAKEIVTLTGGDNDIDKLFMMIKRINKAAAKKGKLEPVEYDITADIETQSEEAIENMLIDISHVLLTSKGNAARFKAPQSPDSLSDNAILIAHNSLPYEQQMKIDRNTGQLVYRPDDPNWNDDSYYDIPGVKKVPGATGIQQMKKHIEELSDRCVYDLGDMVFFKEMHALAKLGVAIAADNTSTFSKVMAGAEAVSASMRFKTEGWGRLPEGITIDGHPLENYCPREDLAGNSAYENCSNFAATLVDSGNSPDVKYIGITLQNASIAAFFLRCGLTPEMMCYMVNIMSNVPNFKNRYNSLYRRLTREATDEQAAGKLADTKDLGSFTMEDLRRAQALAAHGRLMDEETLANDTGLMSVLHVINYLTSVHDNIMPWTKELKMNSTKHALSNEPASAVYAQLLVEEVEQRVAQEDFLIEIPTSMCLHSGLRAEQVAKGVFTEEGGVEKQSGVHMVQAYYSCGIETFNNAMDKRLFYAHPAFKQLVDSFKEVIMNLPKDDAVAFIKQLHDEFSNYYLSGTDMMAELGNADNEVDRYIKTRDYYRYQFPREIGPNLNDAEAKEKYAIMRVLKVDSGRLVIDDELLGDVDITDVRDSLVKMATNGTAAEKALARDIFLNAYFTDGLRFGYGSVSKIFTPSFLANEAFDEYNEEIDKLCHDRMVTGEDLADFRQQFIRNNYNSKKYCFGPLIRAVSSATRDENGMWVAVENHEDLDLREDEVSYKDVRDLEMWLTRRESEGKIYLDETELENANGTVVAKAPNRLIALINKMDLQPGSVFRLQTTFSEFDQNLYMVNEDAEGTYIIKLADILTTKWYCRGADFMRQAQEDVATTSRGGTGTWSSTMTGSLKKKNDMRKAFLNGGVGKFLEDLNKKREERMKKMRQSNDFGESDAVETVSETEYASEVETAEGMEYVSQSEVVESVATSHGLYDDEFTQDKKKPKKEQPKRAKYKGGKVVEINMYSEEDQALREYNASEDDDSTTPVDRMEMFFTNEDGTRYMNDVIQPMYGDEVADQTDEERIASILSEHGADVVFSSRQEAIDMAAQINTSQDSFIATVQEEGNGFKLNMRPAADTQAAQEWADQYGVSAMTGIHGINSVMNKVGTPQEGDFVAYDDALTVEDFNTEVDDIIDLINAAFGLKRFPAWISQKTAEDFLRKARRNVRINGFMTNLKGIIMDAVSGNQQARDAIDGAVGTAPAQQLLDGITDVMDVNDPRVEQAAKSIAADILSNGTAMVQLDTFGNGTTAKFLLKKIREQLHAGIFDEISTKLRRDDTDRLGEIKRMAIANRGTLTPQERARIEANARRNSNSLNEMDRLYSILYDAMLMEEQKRKMIIENGGDTTTSNTRIEELTRILGDDTNGPNVQGVVNYLGHLIKEYKMCANMLAAIPDLNKQQNLENLYKIKRVLQSHEQFLEAITTLMNNEQFLDKFNDVMRVNGQDEYATIRELVDDITELNLSIRDQYATSASKEFISFVTEFVGEDDTLVMSDGTTVTWAQLMEQYDGDISFIDKWLRSVSDIDDPIGQIFNRVMQRQKDKARDQAIEDQQGEIKALNDFIIANNLTDFEFMFEHDEDGKKTGYYLTEVENGRFYKELEQKQAERDAVLNSRTATAEEKTAATAAYDSWFGSHAAVDSVGHVTPNRSMYASRAYEELRHSNPEAFEFLKKFMEIKRRYDARLGAHTNNNRAIQRRMSSEQRFKANFTLSPRQFWENLKRRLAADYLVKEDDYMEAGQESTVLNFDGTRRMVMPAPYVRMLKNPDELSTDPIGCLCAYSYATANYTAMREIANPLEVGYDALLEGRIQYEERNGRTVVEPFRRGAKKRAIVKESRFFQVLRSLMDSQLYMRYIADADDTFKVFGKEFRKSKAVNAFLHMAAVAQLGFNWLVDLANLANGIAQTNIEAAGRRFFRGATLRKADAEYMKALTDFIPDLSNPIKKSKLALVGQKLNIMQNFDVKVYDNRRNGLIAKIFNTSVAFLGTSCGNHWLYNRVAIAMMLETEVTLEDGTKTNLWDALEVVDNGQGGKQVQVKAGAKVDGEVVTDTWLHDFGRRVAKVNQSLLGIYNRDDMVMAQKLSMAKLLIAFRKHVVVMMDKRWRKKHRVAEFAGTDKEWQEGYMRTLGHFLQGLHQAGYKIPAAWNNLDETEKQNVIMAITDIAQWAAVFGLMCLLNMAGGDDDDDDEAYLEKICKFLLAREAHELGSMLPTLYMPKEAVNVMNQPFMGTSQIESMYNFCSTMMQPWTWDERVKAGPFQGQTQIEMRFRKLPIPVLSYYRNLDKTFHGVDNSTWFYNRGYVGGTGKI